MYFLQKDDIMLHFTLSGSSDITGYQCLLSWLFFAYFKSGGRFKIELKSFSSFYLALLGAKISLAGAGTHKSDYFCVEHFLGCKPITI